MSDWFARRAVIALLAFVLGCISMSTQELRYVFSGHTVDATLVSAQEERVSKRPGSMTFPQLRVEYTFDDAENPRQESDVVPTDWPVTKAQKTIAVDLTGKWLSSSREVRIVTNLCIYWDEIFLSEGSSAPSPRLTDGRIRHVSSMNRTPRSTSLRASRHCFP